MVPVEHLRDDGRIDLVLLEQQVEDLLLPERLEGVGVDPRKYPRKYPRKWDERAVASKGTVGHQRVQVGVKVNQLAEGVDGPDHARRRVPAVQNDAVDFEHRLPGEPGQLAEKPAVESEEDPQTLGNREDETVGGRRGRTDHGRCDRP